MKIIENVGGWDDFSQQCAWLCMAIKSTASQGCQSLFVSSIETTIKMLKFKLRFPITKIQQYADAYSYEGAVDEKELMNRREGIIKRGHLTQAEFQDICRWKTERSKSRVARNSEKYVKEVTGIALTTSDDQLRIRVLTLLEGVLWPTASVILHFYHEEKFPIIDFRALYSLSREDVTPDKYNYMFWKEYSEFARHLAAEAGVSMRTLDRALWQYSKKP